MSDELFATLDDIDWASLEHVYGSAEIVPDLLRELASDDIEEAYEAFESLLDLVWHPEGLVSATPRTIPFVVEIIEKTESPMRSDLVTLLHHMMFEIHLEIAMGFHVGDSALQQHIIDTIKVAIPIYISWLKDESIRAETAELLSVFYSECNLIAPQMLEMLKDTDEPQLQCLLVDSMTALMVQSGTCSDHVPYIKTLHELKTSNVMPLRYLASVGLVELKAVKADDESYAILKDTLIAPQKYVLPDIQVNPLLMTNIRIDVLKVLVHVDPAIGLPILSDALEALQDIPDDEQKFPDDAGITGLFETMQSSFKQVMTEELKDSLDGDDEFEDEDIETLFEGLIGSFEDFGLEDMIESSGLYAITQFGLNVQFVLMNYALGDDLRVDLEMASVRDLPSGESEIIFEPIVDDDLPMWQSLSDTQLQILKIIHQYDLFWKNANNMLELHGFPQDRDALAQFIVEYES